MLRNFKSLFIKTDEVETEKTPSQPESFSFPINNNSQTPDTSNSTSFTDPEIKEVIKVYEQGLESINMQGYDFYEFFQSVTIAGNNSEQAYTMAFQMAKTLDKTITTSKLLHDAEFYISKINDVHSQYIAQGQAKLSAINDKKSADKKKLTNEIDQASARITQLKAELQQLESNISSSRTALGKIDESHYPQEKSIKEKLSANDFAHKTSIDKLNIVKDCILKYIKG